MASYYKSLFSRFQLTRYSSSSSLSPLLTLPLSPSSSPSSSSSSSSRTHFTFSASLSSQQHDPRRSLDTTTPRPDTRKPNWKPICLYFTQGKCTMMDDPIHLEKFNHSCSEPLEQSIATSVKLRQQHVDFLLVLDLEGKVEILEFPVMVVDAKTMEVVDFFHRFVRPTKMGEQRINEYIEGKYGKLGVDSDSVTGTIHRSLKFYITTCVGIVFDWFKSLTDYAGRVWHDTAIPFRDVIQEFETWMCHHHLWQKELGGTLQRAAFVTCGNWDIKTKVPQQCQVCSMKIPPYFMEWINLKDVYLNFYNRRASGMRTMLNELRIPLLGSHHLGIDDTKNIVRVLQRMLADGALMQITARRDPANPETVEFLYKNRIR